MSSVTTPDPELTPAQQHFATSRDFLDSSWQDDREASRRYAHRARNLDAARQHGERAVHLTDYGTDPGAEFAGWTKSEIAFRGFVPEVACKLHITEKAAEALVVTATTLVHELTATLDLLEAGDTSYKHAESMARHSHRVPEEYRAEYEAKLLPFAKTLTPAKFDRKARGVADSYQEDPLEERHREAMERRCVELIPEADGMAEVRIYADAVDAHAVYNRMTDIARSLQHPGEPRSLTQLRADVATRLLIDGVTVTPGTDAPGYPITGAVAGFHPALVGKGERKGARKGLGVGIVATVAIKVPVLSLLGKDDEPATLDGYGPISKKRALELMGTATSFTRILTHPETGTILSVGTERYRVPAAMRLFLMTRDLTCRFPGCSIAARFCDLDHTEDWQFGGATEDSNLASLCAKHHDLKHHTDWTYQQDKYGVCTWVSPAGETYRTDPEVWVHGMPPTPPEEETVEEANERIIRDAIAANPRLAEVIARCREMCSNVRITIKLGFVIATIKWPWSATNEEETAPPVTQSAPPAIDEVTPPEGFPF
jgi:hypothetical protein